MSIFEIIRLKRANIRGEGDIPSYPVSSIYILIRDPMVLR